MSGATTSRTIGYKIYGKIIQEYANVPGDRSAFSWTKKGEGTLFPTSQAALEAIIEVARGGDHWGVIELHRVVETTYTETKTETVPLN